MVQYSKVGSDAQIEAIVNETLASDKLLWEKPEFASVQPISETHAIGGVGADVGVNHS